MYYSLWAEKWDFSQFSNIQHLLHGKCWCYLTLTLILILLLTIPWTKNPIITLTLTLWCFITGAIVAGANVGSPNFLEKINWELWGNGIINTLICIYACQCSHKMFCEKIPSTFHNFFILCPIFIKHHSVHIFILYLLKST